MPTNKKYRDKLQASIKKVSDVVKDIELLTMAQSIPDADRDVFTASLDQQVRKIKQALRSEPLDVELEWAELDDEEADDEKPEKSTRKDEPVKPNDTFVSSDKTDSSSGFS